MAKVTKTETQQPVESAQNPMEKRKYLLGVVTSDKMQKTIVVRIDRRVRHKFYNKYVVMSQKFKAHDEQNEAKTGDLVQIVESRPLSRDKRWVLRSVVRKAGPAGMINA